MKEIGGYFGLEETHKGCYEYYPDLIALNSARNAVFYICKARGYNKIYIPLFLCDAVSSMCMREHIQFEYYHIDIFLRPVFEKSLKEDECLYVVNYYGQLKRSEILKYFARFKNIIIDNVQAFFERPINGIDTIYSCRKFFGVPDGAYLSTNCYLKNRLKKSNPDKRLSHLFGRIIDGASKHYEEFLQSEELLSSESLMSMSKFSRDILKRIDYKSAKAKREKNYSILEKQLKRINKLNVRMPSGPFSYPLFVEDGDKMRKTLAAKKIYIPLLWPNVDDGLEKKLADNILPLPCDQRYSESDMLIIIEEVLKCLN